MPTMEMSGDLNTRTGGTLDGFLEEEGILEETAERAIRAVLAMELADTMQEKGITKREMARRLETSRTQLNRLLDPEAPGGVTVATLAKAARVLGKRVRLDLIDAA